MSTPERVHRPYCLHCYAPLERAREAVHECPRCGAPNLEVDLRLYWTREQRFVRLERAVKLAIALFIGWISVSALFAMEHHIGTGQGWAAGLPILGGVVLWDTASKITRRDPYFDAGLLWSVMLLVVGVPTLLLGLAGLAALERGAPLALVLGLLLTGAVLVALAIVASHADRAWKRWQERYVRERSRTA